MSRPPDFTDATRAACDDEIARFREAQRRGEVADQINDFLFDIPHFREAWYCGVWLEGKLLDAGCDRVEARRHCFANGQKIAMSADPWAPTRRTLADYLAGRPMDEPGRKLADRLLGGES
jgi:hypothetical protein